MLPAHLLSLERSDGYATPRYLSARDEVWIRSVLDVFDAFVGRRAGERDELLPPRVRAIAREHGVAERVVDGVTMVLMRRYKTHVVAAVDPVVARQVVFARAAENVRPDRQSALARAAAQLDVSPLAVAQALFADRAAARVVRAGCAATSAEAVEAYNLALLQGVLLRSELVVARVREHVGAVIRFAKRSGLLCTYAADADGTHLEISGPLAVLRHTTRYGFALASFLPAVLATAGSRLEARCVLNDEPVHVRIDASDRIACSLTLPKDGGSPLERALARDVLREGRGWTLSRATSAIAHEKRLFFPDFTLQRGDQAVLVEVVGFYTPEYLRSKLDALRAARDHRLIVCVDESLACDEGDVPGTIIRFKRTIDAGALLDAADALVREGS